MWKKLPLYNRPHNDTIGSPVLINSTIDDKTLHEIPSISDLNSGQFSSYSLSAKPAFGRRNTDDVMRGSLGLPELPFKSLEPSTEPHERPISDVPTASSIYSQPTPDLRQHYSSRFDATTSPPFHHDVSPPSSPEAIYPEENYRRQSEGWQGSPSVSPVQELPEISESESEHRYEPSSTVRSAEGTHGTQKKKPGWGFFGTLGGKRATEPPPDRDSTMTKWDDFSGEPTTDASGRAPQIDARSPPFANEAFNSNHGSRDSRFDNLAPIETGARGPAKPIIAEKAPESRQEDLTPTRAMRNEWIDPYARGETRSPIMDKPLPATKPLIIPRRSSKRGVPTMEGASGTSTPNSAFIRSDASIISSSTSDDGSSLRPLVPLKAGKNSPPRTVVSPVPYYNRDYRSPSPGQPDVRHNGLGSTSNDRYRDKPLPIPKDDDLVVRKNRRSAGTIENNFRSAMNDMHFQEEPVSRFSATTYATETTYDSRPGSPALSSSNFTPTPSSSILNRKRPVPGATNARDTTRKPTPSQLSARTSDPRRNSKSLPQSPPELESVDLITSLQAQLDNLHHQRGNIQRLLRDLSQLNLTTQGITSRADIKRKADKLQQELSEIMREEHDIGLRLHRAWRRKDQQESCEPTGLWVRRVTG
ncbi:MAG: hypothetical protein M1812_006533 [Candelaria pacifica]|nr:MAG: hypothetical protein M1812_006533 [Candelaria pacifica]